MSKTRVSVEWVFGDILNYFKFLDFKKNLKIGLSAVSKMYIVCALLHNARCCLYGSLTSSYFDCDAPVIENILCVRTAVLINYMHSYLFFYVISSPQVFLYLFPH